ncbi:hypothetical protein ColTof4_10267 [Colletotrichum tofieldiae]|nr:hypothetical protein ColTof3_06072 [Colletotrichum tofieldiae]GKT77844.1 hypothetical protein ColTof4_10267 [Colletotrichum tofieldiae]
MKARTTRGEVEKRTVALLPIIDRRRLVGLVKHQRRQLAQLDLAMLVAHDNLRRFRRHRGRSAVREHVDVETQRLGRGP